MCHDISWLLLYLHALVIQHPVLGWCPPHALRRRISTSTRPPYPATWPFRLLRGSWGSGVGPRYANINEPNCVGNWYGPESELWSNHVSDSFPYQSSTHNLRAAQVPCQFMVREQKSPWGEGPHPHSRIFLSHPIHMHLHEGV